MVTSNSNSNSQTELELASFREEKERLENNRQLVLRFLSDILGDRNFDAIPAYIADDYIQHNPLVADGRTAFTEFIVAAYSEESPRADIRKIMADGDCVFVHMKSSFGGAPISVMDVYRIENGKIAEHWDVIQAVPKTSANDHPMF